MVEGGENPYQLMMRWILTEVLELTAMKDCINTIKLLENKIAE